MTRNNFMHDGTFNRNMLVVGQTHCGKTSFVQRLGKNKMFGSIYSVDWISKIELTVATEHQIRESFVIRLLNSTIRMTWVNLKRY